MNNKIRAIGYSIRDSLRAQLWPIPAISVVFALILGTVIPDLDAVIDGSLPQWLDALVFSGDAGAARTVLDAVSSSLITVTSLTFSLTVVTLQLASSQFSPRLLRTFTGDIFVQVTLAIFLSTFTYSLTVLRSVRSEEESIAPFVPRIAVSISFFLAIASVFALVFFLAHITSQIRVETILEKVHSDAIVTAAASLKRLDAPETDDTPTPYGPLTPPPDTLTFVSWRSGFLLRIDQDILIELATSLDAYIRFDRIPGSYVVERTPIARIWREDPGSLSEEEQEQVESTLKTAVIFGAERTGTQDVGYGLRQLVDVVNKALSPGVNDPTTAMHGLGYISAFLSELAQYQLGPVAFADSEEITRVECARYDFGDYLEIAINQPRRYGGPDSFLARRILQLLRDLAWAVPSDHFEAVLGQLDRTRELLETETYDHTERSEQSDLVAEVERIIASRRREEAQSVDAL